MPLRLLAIGLLLAACAHPRTQQADVRPASPAARTEASPGADGPGAAPAPEPTAQRVDFARDVRPILESRCRPCHFEGGRVYDRLPFDREETIRQLGTRLFTRIKAENEQALIRQFLAQDE